MVDLNDRVPAGWRIAEAYAINDAGQIAAIGSFGTGGHLRALRLTPEAPALVLLAPRPGRAGAHNRFELRWGTPGETAVVLAANGLGNAGFAPCGLALDIAAAREVGRAAADAQGVGVFGGFVSAARAGPPIYFQAVELNTCHKSAIAVQTFE